MNWDRFSLVTSLWVRTLPIDKEHARKQNRDIVNEIRRPITYSPATSLYFVRENFVDFYL